MKPDGAYQKHARRHVIGYDDQGDHRGRYLRLADYLVCNPVDPETTAYKSHAASEKAACALHYRCLPVGVAFAISSETVLASEAFTFGCLGLRASLLPFLFAITVSFPHDAALHAIGMK